MDISERSKDMCAERYEELSVLESIHRALLELGPDHKSNVIKLTRLCGELTNASIVVYNRFEKNSIRPIGQYFARKDLAEIDFSKWSFCKEIVNKSSDRETVISDLTDSPYSINNEFIKSGKLTTYIGKPIRSEGEFLGILCLFYEKKFIPSDNNLRAIGIIGALTGNEDKRMRDNDLQESNNIKIRALMEASSKASQALISNINFEDAVKQVLDIIEEATNQDRTYIYEFIHDGSSSVKLRQRFEKTKDDIPKRDSQLSNFGMNSDKLYERWYSWISKGVPIKGNVDDLPQVERDFLKSEGVMSIIVLPIFVNEKCWGIIGLDSCKNQYNWSESEANILLNTASALGMYMFRNLQRLELIAAKEQAEESEVYANAFFEQSPSSIQLVNTNGTTDKVNKAFDTLFNIPKDKIGKFNILTDRRSKRLAWDKILDKVMTDKNVFLSEMIFSPSYFNYSGEKKYLSLIAFPITFKGRVKKVAFMYQDITNLKNYEKEQERQKLELIEKSNIIKENELKYRTIIENSFNLIGQFSLDGKFIYYNRVYKDVLGYDNNELLGINCFDLFHPNELDRIKVALFNHLMRNNEVKFVAQVRTKSGEYKLIDHKFRILEGENEKERTILLSAQDITEMNRNEILLQMQRNLAYSIISCKNFIEFHTVICNEINSIIPANSLYVAFLDEKTGMCSLGGISDEIENIENWPAEGSLTGYTIKENKPVFINKQEIINLSNSGKIKLLGTMAEVWLGVPFKSEGGTIGAIVVQNFENPNALSRADIEILELVANEICIFLDKKNAEENALKLTKAVTESPASVVITDVNGNIEYVNPKFTSITGYSYEEVIGLNPRILKSGTTPESQYENLWKTIRSGKEWRGEFKNKKKNGEFFWEDISISPIFDDDYKISHYVAVKEDITDRKKIITQLIEARDKAEESDRLKTSFLQNISHEIRTPMNGIMGFLGLLRDPDTTGEEKNLYFDIIEKSSQRMLSTINDIIDISKIEAGVVTLKKSSFFVDQIASDVVNFFRPEVEKKKMRISLKIDNSVYNLEIKSDYEKIYATLTNLIKNSIKYSIKGEINVSVRKETDCVVFSVQDTGIGIPKEKLDIIFERFIQAESESVRTYEGAGLGLSIVKAYVELLGGRIFVESELGRGSRFTFTIPFEIQKPTENDIDTKSEINLHLSDKVTTKPIKILIAEDEEINALYLKTLLMPFNFELFFAKNGKEAVDLFEQNTDISLILMDIRMPEMSGSQATRIIKAINSHVTVIAQTAYAFTGDKEKALDEGFDDYLSKPIVKKDLFAILKKYTS